jgi:hypothetical protein
MPGRLSAGAKALFSRPPETVGSFAMVQPQLTQVFQAPMRTVGDGADRGSIMDDAWQAEAYRLARALGEVGYVQNLSANTLAQGDLVIEEWKGGRWVPSADERAQRVLAAFVDPRGSNHDLKRRAGIHLGIAGESWLVGSPARTPRGINTGIVWEFLSGQELQMNYGQPDHVERRKEGMTGQKLGKDVYIARLWQSDPEFSLQADSAMRRAIPIAQEVLKLTQLVSAVADSRLNAGIFYVPWDFGFQPDDDEATDGDPDSYGDEEVPNDGIDEFTKKLINQLKAAKENPASAAGLIPLIMRGPAMIGEKAAKELMGLISLERDLDSWCIELRQEAIHRLAVALDTPIEVMEGKGGLNHWTGFNVDGDMIARHVAPKGFLLADFLTVAYLRPMLEAYESVSPNVAQKFRVRYDISALKSALDEATFTRFAYDRKEASGQALRRSHGVNEADAPDDDELAARNAIEMIKAVPILAPALLPKVPGLEDVDVALVAELIVGHSHDEGETGAPAGRKQQADSQRTLGPGTSKTSGSDEPARNGPSQAMASLVERLTVAASEAVERAFERAGSKVTAAAQGHRKDPTLRDRLNGRDKATATAMITSTELKSLGLTSGDLLSGAFDNFALKARGWLRDFMVREGLEGMAADEQAAFAISQLCGGLEAYSRDFLHRGLPTHPNGLRVPDEMVSVALSSLGPTVLVMT